MYSFRPWSHGRFVVAEEWGYCYMIDRSLWRAWQEAVSSQLPCTRKEMVEANSASRQGLLLAPRPKSAENVPEDKGRQHLLSLRDGNSRLHNQGCHLDLYGPATVVLFPWLECGWQPLQLYDHYSTHRFIRNECRRATPSSSGWSQLVGLPHPCPNRRILHSLWWCWDMEFVCRGPQSTQMLSSSFQLDSALLGVIPWRSFGLQRWEPKVNPRNVGPILWCCIW
jgi:hypothetical protein